jgi:hypothetical protein
MKHSVFVKIVSSILVIVTASLSISTRGGDQNAAGLAQSPGDAPCGLLGGVTIDPMESTVGWQASAGDGAISATMATVAGCQGQAVQLNYNLGAATGAYAQLRRDFNPPLDLSAFDHLRFQHRGTAPNTIQIGLVSNVSGNDVIHFANPQWKRATGVPWCTYATWDLKGFLGGGPPPNFQQVKAIFISVKNVVAEGDAGGIGSFIVDELQGVNIGSRSVSASFEQLNPGTSAAQQAANWIAARQQAGGLLKSWQEEAADLSWLYDQAVGLLVLADTEPSRANQLAVKLLGLQNGDKSWYAGYHYLTDVPINTEKPIGANAWMVYALMQYSMKSGNSTAGQAARDGAAWLASLQQPNGNLGSGTEANLDGWWAFHITGRRTEADRLRDFLLNQVWDSQMGRFKSDPNEYHIFLDNQTWGAAFLRAVGREADARRALSYARRTLNVTSRGTPFGDVCGFDGAGPFGVWNEGTSQYIAMRGENSQFYWGEMLRQQAQDGGVPGTPLANEFSAYIVWLTPMHGVAPTAWLYFAATGGPFFTGLMFYPLPAPVRLLDTRPGFAACSAPDAPLGDNAVRMQQAVGACTRIPATAKAIVGNATVVNSPTISTGFHWITLFPSDAVQPNTSNVNFKDNQIKPNWFTVRLGPDGAFKIYSHAATHFIIDVTGYYAAPGQGGLYYHPLSKPVRLLDTRPGESSCNAEGVPLANDGTKTVMAVGACLGETIPASAKAIVGNATVVNFISSGFHWITLYPSDEPQPNASNLNFTDNQIVPNWFITGLSDDGKFNIYSHASTHFIVDVTGYFSEEPVDANGLGLLFNVLAAPVRVLETRPGENACFTPGVPLDNNGVQPVMATGACTGVPSSARAVEGNATVVNFISSGFHWITIYPCGEMIPVASNLNFIANDIVPNYFIVRFSNDGKFCIYSHASTHFVVDLTAYFAP